MKRASRTRPWITLMLVGAIAGGAGAQVAVAQETSGDTGATDDEKVVFTWGGTAEPTSLNPMSGYSAIDANGDRQEIKAQNPLNIMIGPPVCERCGEDYLAAEELVPQLAWGPQ